MAKKLKHYGLNDPLIDLGHSRPRTRRDFLGQGLRTGVGTVLGGSLFSLFADPHAAHAALAPDVQQVVDDCGISADFDVKIPFVCFDLAGGANIAGSNVLVGGQGGQLDFLSTAGYNKQGLPGDMVPSIVNPDTNTNDFVNTQLGLAFHSTSAMLAGILEKTTTALTGINGAVIPARSENDTGNNPHNPMYGIHKAGAQGQLITLIGSRSSDSGGNSMAPAMLIDPEVRPTKVDRPSDVTGLVDVGDLVGLLDQSDTVAVMESIFRITDRKLGRIHSGVVQDAVIKDLLRCNYAKSAHLANEFGDPSALNPLVDTNLVGPGGVFTADEFNGDREFRKTASVAKLVMNGYSGAGTITMGGYDYHTGDRATGERRDLRAGRCIGAVLEYAAKIGRPVMVYVFSDGSVFSNGNIDDSQDGAGKGVWTGDSQQTAASFFLVYNPAGRPVLRRPENQQIGYMRGSGDVETASSPAANNVNLLVETVILNYMALHGDEANFGNLFPGHGLGNAGSQDLLMAFSPIVNGKLN